jgi:hypothetical protein
MKNGRRESKLSENKRAATIPYRTVAIHREIARMEKVRTDRSLAKRYETKCVGECLLIGGKENRKRR